MKKLRIVTAILSLLSLLIVSGSPVFAAPRVSFPGGDPVTSVSQTGNDVSWPQCGKSLPKGHLFGIVGVNDGLANTTNPCFTTELSWANNSIGSTRQPKASLYVNTANPGNLGVSDWPTTGVNVYGTCKGGNTEACAYQYGWDMAQEDTGRIGTNAPNSYKWWLDVETNNSWETTTTNNVADLEGMTAYFESINASVGLYSTASQWKQIAGSSVSPTSNLDTLTSWIPGAGSLTVTKSNCSLSGLTKDSKVTVTQYVSKQVDYDYSCV